MASANSLRSLVCSFFLLATLADALRWQSVGQGRCFGWDVGRDRLLSLSDCQALCLRTAGCLAVSSEAGSDRDCLLFPSCEQVIGGSPGSSFRLFQSFVLVTDSPSSEPTNAPSNFPSATPTTAPTLQPTLSPSMQPSMQPTVSPTSHPSVHPTVSPTSHPSQSTEAPSHLPTSAPQHLDDMNATRASASGQPSGGLVVVGLLSFFLGMFLLSLFILLLARTRLWEKLGENGVTAWIARQGGAMEFFTTAPLVLAYFDLTSDIVFAVSLLNNGVDFYSGVALMCCLVALLGVNGSLASWIIYRSDSAEFDAWRKSYPRHLVLLRFSSIFSLDSFAVFRSSELFNSGHLDIPFINTSTNVYGYLGLLNHVLEDIPVLIMAGMLSGTHDQTTVSASGLSAFTSAIVLFSRFVQLSVHFTLNSGGNAADKSSKWSAKTKDKSTHNRSTGPANASEEEKDYNGFPDFENQNSRRVDPTSLEYSSEHKAGEQDIQLA